MITLSTPPTKQEAEAIIAAGTGTIVAHPRAGSKRGRVQLRTQLGHVGVPNRLAMTLAWTTDAGPVPAPPVPVAEPTPVIEPPEGSPADSGSSPA